MEVSFPAFPSSGWRRLAISCGVSAAAALLLLFASMHGQPVNFALLAFVPWLACVGWFLSAQPIRAKSIYLKVLFAGGLAFAMAATAVLALGLGVFVFPN